MPFIRQHCVFCITKALVPSRRRWLDVILMCLLVRRYRCPHCFEGYMKFLVWRIRSPIG
tara:strand:- start:991 stop:1167 length:177 start_codon:yes stop_codon:yes gene_type:complete